MLIYKILRTPEWVALCEAGESDGAPIDVADGYIHFSTATQAQETADKHFAGETELMVLAVETEPLGAALVWEPSRGGQLFPHLYRRLRLSDVRWARAMGAGNTMPEGVE